jgi:hypothetical protein
LITHTIRDGANILFAGFDLSYGADRELTLNGKLNGKSITVKEDDKNKKFIAKVEPNKEIYIKDIIVTGNKAIDKIIANDAFNRAGFESFDIDYGDDKKLLFNGSVATKAFNLMEDVTNKKFSLSASGIGVGDVIGVNSAVLNNLTFTGFDLSYGADKELTLNGKLNDKSITIKEDGKNKKFIAKVEPNKEIYVKDVIVTGNKAIDKIIANDAFNRAGFEGFDIDYGGDKKLLFNGNIATKTFSLTEDVTNKKFNLSASGIGIGDVIGVNSAVLNNLTFTGFELNYGVDKELTLSGKLNDKSITIREDDKNKKFIAKVLTLEQ